MLRLLRSEHVGPVTFRRLLQRCGSAAVALEALPALARRGGRRQTLRIAGRAEAEAELERVERLGGRALYLGEAAYPAALAALEDAPPILYLLGDPALLSARCVALVGARNASGNGQRLAQRFAAELSAAGVTVVSGLARGIDGAAHRGALPRTVAVVAGGLDVIYPPQHRDLAAEIAAKGAVVAEMAPGTVPQARHFPRRNRIISGLSLVVVVVEAAPRSGSLITARLALEQGREVLAVPGSPLDPRAQGCNLLIRQGAVLVQTAEDILETLPPVQRRAFAAPLPPAFRPQAPVIEEESLPSEERAALLSLLSPSPVAVDEVVRRCQFSASLVQDLLLELELAGRLERYAGNRVALVA